ncbi:MAG TPA: DUF2933 domain-containing protein [Gaiellaceae bacterium]|nr:DUF2933 domain-containing protein [Gaiellaceae bacterium]
MELGALLILLLIACPLLMVLMHRSGHGGHPEHGGDRCDAQGNEGSVSGLLDELRRRRDQLDTAIALLEQSEIETGTSVTRAVRERSR